jgi:hypothetical protein
MAPVCNIGGPYTAECAGGFTVIQLDGTGSFDPDGLPLSFRWEVGCDRARIVNPTSATPLLIVKTGGRCTVGCPKLYLRVSSASGSSACITSFDVVDTTPPTLSCPPPASVVTGNPTDPSVTGFATAVDTCNAATVTWSDVSFQASEEQIIVQRTWVADDGCQTSSCVQTITVAPYLIPHVDVLPGVCPNPFVVSSGGGSKPAVPLSVLGNAFDPTEADLTSLRLSVSTVLDQGGPEDFIVPIAVAIADTGTPFIGPQCDCHALNGDGIPDLALQFDEDQMKVLLGLINQPVGSTVVLQLSGKLLDGTPFIGEDCVVIQ